MGVFTKQDLATEQATQQTILDLVMGKRNDLRLGYSVVKNRGADDFQSSLDDRNRTEREFFASDPWRLAASLGRFGIDALARQLRSLLMDITKLEMPNVKADITSRLKAYRKSLEAMGHSRSDAEAQQRYLGKLSGKFQEVTKYALDAYYTGDDIFTEKPEMKLITRVLRANEEFNRLLWEKGHTRKFQSSKDDNDEFSVNSDQKKVAPLPSIDDFPELHDIVVDPWDCPQPGNEDIMEYIQEVFETSKGPDLGTFGASIVVTVFKEQSKKWESIVLQHVSAAIIIVHQYISALIAETCQDTTVRQELWDNLLLDELQAASTRAMDRARFLLNIERGRKPMTYSSSFASNLSKDRAKRLGSALSKMGSDHKDDGFRLDKLKLTSFSGDKANNQQIGEDIHDILKSYYKVARQRFVDVICQQVIDHFLLSGEPSPLRIFSPDLVMSLSADQLEMIAGEDAGTKVQRQTLMRDIESLKAAMKVLRG